MDRTLVTYRYLDYVRRAAVPPPPGLALGVRSTVWASFRPGEFEDSAVRPWVKIMWSLRGRGAVRVSARKYRLEAGRVAVFVPGTRHEAWAETDWECRWLTLDGPMCAAIATALNAGRAGVYPAAGDLGGLIDRCREGLVRATPEGARDADSAAYELLSRVGAGAATPRRDPVSDEALRLFRSNAYDPTFGVTRAARLIGIHRSVLSRRFHAQVGFPPQQHLLDLRLGQALMLLRSTDLSVREVAFQCGFSDAAYFGRYFRKRQGVTPASYRSAHDA